MGADFSFSPRPCLLLFTLHVKSFQAGLLHPTRFQLENTSETVHVPLSVRDKREDTTKIPPLHCDGV